MISIDQFAEIQLRVGTVKTAERVEGSAKLLKLHIDLGEETLRQVLAGIGKAYAPEALLGRQLVIVANLAPRMMMGFESNGMVLATGETAEEVVILSPEKEVKSGSLIR